jgi:hypothetical protein
VLYFVDDQTIRRSYRVINHQLRFEVYTFSDVLGTESCKEEGEESYLPLLA